MCENKSDAEKLAAIVHDAGDQLIGRTRLQKIACLLELAEQGDGFNFSYHHYGPYSEDLANAASVASALNLVNEQIKSADWGGKYSIFTLNSDKLPRAHSNRIRKKLTTRAAQANAIALELATTAAYLAKTGVQEAWSETAQRKPDKAGNGRLEEAKALYNELRSIADTLPVVA